MTVVEKRTERTRAVPFTLERADDTDNGLHMTGYAAVFDTPTRIDDWDGVYDEQIAPGAFKRSLDHRKPLVMFNHGHHSSIGDIPIGSIRKVREDSRGLYVEADLFDNDLVKPVSDAIRGNAIDGMSFRFTPINEERDDSGDIPLITRTEVQLHELGPVTFPAYPTTSVGIRSVAEVFEDPEGRAELARLLATGTRPEPASALLDGSPDDDPPSSTRRITQAARLRRLRTLQLT